LSGEPTLVVLAAGIGRRYGGMKQLAAVGPTGETIMDYSVFDAVRAGFRRVVFVIRRETAADFREYARRRFEGRIEVAYAFQETDRLPPPYHPPAGRTKPWGTGHAVLAAAGMVKGPFGLINADDFYGEESFRVLAESLAGLRAETAEYVLVGFRLRDTLSEHGAVARGICRVDGDGRLVELKEYTDISRDGSGLSCCGGGVRFSGEETVSMNMWGFTPVIFDQLGEMFLSFLREHGRDERAEFYISTSISRLVAQGAAVVRVVRGSATWCGITHAADRRAAAERIAALIEEGRYPRALWEKSG